MIPDDIDMAFPAEASRTPAVRCADAAIADTARAGTAIAGTRAAFPYPLYLNT